MKLRPNNSRSIFYAAGPGNVVGTYSHWLSGICDPNEVSETYSGQFFQTIKELDHSALVIASHPRSASITDARFIVKHCSKTTHGRSGLSYHFADISYWLGVIWRIIRSRASVAVVADMEHWWLLSLLSLAGVKVVPTLHCTFWPKGYRQSGLKDNVIQTLNSWFWRNIPVATICISPECQNQVEVLAGKRVHGVLLQARAKYRLGFLSCISAPVWSNKPFRLLFAGRIEANKGVFDLITLVGSLSADHHLSVFLEICGDGSAFSELTKQVNLAGLDAFIKLHGKLDQSSMLQAYQRCHAVVVPTSANFPEGLNKVVVEGVLAGRPVVASIVCNANEVFPNSVIEVQPGDIAQMTAVLVRLATDEAYYNVVRSHCQLESVPFYDESQSWGAAVKRAIQHALANG